MGADAGLVDYLSSFVTDHKKELIENVLNQRTSFLSVVLEDIYDPQNASAVVRSCDCFGIQHVHIIEQLYDYQINPKVMIGSEKWVDIHRHNEAKQDNTETCLHDLKQKGYIIAATVPDSSALPIQEYSFTGPTALVFGNEKYGVSEEALNMADVKLTIPMVGFTESFNLSVSAALCLYQMTTNLKKSDCDWQLSDEEKMVLRQKWYKRIVNKGELLEKEYYNKG